MTDIKSRSEIYYKMASGVHETKERVEKGWSKRIAEAETIEQRKATENCLRVYREFHP